MPSPQLINFNWTSVVQLLMFLFLMYVLYKLLYKPFFNITEERKRKVEEDLNYAERARKEADQLKKEMQQKLKEARERAEEIISKANKEAEKIISEAKEKAKQEAQKIIENAKREVEAEKLKAIEEVKKQAGEIAVALAVKILSGILDEKAKKEYLLKVIERELKE